MSPSRLNLDHFLAGFSALRIYAIGGKDWKLALVAFALALAPVCTNLVPMFLHDVDTSFR